MVNIKSIYKSVVCSLYCYISDCNPGIEFSIPEFEIREFVYSLELKTRLLLSVNICSYCSLYLSLKWGKR